MSRSYERNPLGLPRGSVRAILTIVITLMFWTYLAYQSPDGQVHKIPSYMYCLATLVFVFFAAHRSTIGPDGTQPHSPLYLPRGAFRFLILGGTLAIVIWQVVVNPTALLEKLTPTGEQMQGWPYLSLTLTAGYMTGWLFSHGPWKKSAWYQDIQAWLSLVAIGFLLINLLIDLIAKSQAHSLEWLPWDCTVIGMLSVYFGARS